MNKMYSPETKKKRKQKSIIISNIPDITRYISFGLQTEYI